MHVLSFMAIFVLQLLDPAGQGATSPDAGALPVPPIQRAGETHTNHVRPMDRFCEQLLTDGTRRSPTFAGLVAELERHDVIVYISTGSDPSLLGSLTFIARGGPVTYLRVRLHPLLGPDDGIPALAHELQHAVEVAGAPRPVTSERELKTLYQLIGFDVGLRSFESTAARTTEAQVRREIRTR
jgi:hypothetical protein